MLTMLEKFLLWEIALTSNQENAAADMIDQGFLPFLNPYPWGKAGKEDFEPATDLLRVYLQAVRPLIIVCLGHEVNSHIYNRIWLLASFEAAYRDFSAGSEIGLRREKFFSSIGELIIKRHAKDEASEGDKDHYIIQITSYHPGALASGGVSQRPMQRVFTLTMFKVWVAMCESLKYSTEHLDEHALCERIINDVGTRLAATSFNADFQSTKDEIIQTNGELRWRNEPGRAASKSMRLSSALRTHAPTSIQGNSKRNDRIGKALTSNRGQALNSTEAAASGMTDDPQNITTDAAIEVSDRQGSFEPKQSTTGLLPTSYYEGRKLLFPLSYCNESKAECATGSLQRKIPLHPGDIRWLLDRFLSQEFPQGGTINCADPSISPKRVPYGRGYPDFANGRSSVCTLTRNIFGAWLEGQAKVLTPPSRL